MLRIVRLFFAIPIFVIFLGLMAILSVSGIASNIFSIIAVIVGSVLFVLFFVFEVKKIVKNEKEYWAEAKKNWAEAKKKWAEAKKKWAKEKESRILKNETLKGALSKFSFEISFGFDPKYVSQLRFEKEVLIKLVFMAKKLIDCANMRAKSDNFYTRYLYNEFHAKYQGSFVSLEKFHPEFAAKLPHWTEMESFVKEWLKRHNFSVVNMS